MSSGERELLALHRLLGDPTARSALSGANVLWLTDSTNFVAFVMKGSPVPSVQQKVFDILVWSRQLHCQISPIHLFREDVRIQEADNMSKIKDTDNWSVDFMTFEKFNKDFQFEVDLFADNNNKRVSKFVSNYFHPDSMAVDAFSIPWEGMAWLCPPVSLVSRVIRRIRSSPCQGLLIVPNWPTSDYYCDLFHKDVLLQPFVFVEEFHPYIFQNEFATNTPLKGLTAFTFFALYFNTLE